MNPSCAGLQASCLQGASTASCCAAKPVPGGTFLRVNDTKYPATVTGFKLDVYEVVVARFRNFVDAGQGTQSSPPATGAGAHPSIPASGWRAEWNGKLRFDTAALKAGVRCDNTYATYTVLKPTNEFLPINCVTWYEAFAFCVWDGGRLPTEAEWNLAAAGSTEQRPYPWGTATPDPTLAVFDCTGDGSPSQDCSFSDIRGVGFRSPKGDGKFGHSDLAGSMWEMVLDAYDTLLPTPCQDCANIAFATNTTRVERGGHYRAFASDLRTTVRYGIGAEGRATGVGFRCAR
jgi:formylglycine-generating enzyme required for sulfatase activity